MTSEKGNSQNNQILRYFQAGGSLTQLDALQRFGCLRLSARIHNLRDRGYLIERELIRTPSGKHVARFSMEV